MSSCGEAAPFSESGPDTIPGPPIKTASKRACTESDEPTADRSPLTVQATGRSPAAFPPPDLFG